MSDDEQNVSNVEENMGTETDPASATEGNDANKKMINLFYNKTTDETTTSHRRLLSNKMIVIIAAVALVSLIIIIIIIVIFLVMKDSENSNKFAAKAKEKCQEYAQLACTQESKTPKLSDSARIVNGREPPPGILPYMAYILVQDRLSECTGTLISEWFVLSAAHCFNKYNPRYVLSGYLAIVSKFDAFGSTPSFKSTKVYIHDKFAGSKARFEGDIALIKTLEKVILSASVRPICLNTKLENTVGDFISAGYGLTGDYKDSYELRMVELRMDGEVQKKCEKVVSPYFNYEDFTSKMICAAHPTEKKGAHIGDSGAPLLYPLKHKCPDIHEQIGVLLKVEDYTEHDPPVTFLYTKVEYHIEWIVKIVWPDPNQPE